MAPVRKSEVSTIGSWFWQSSSPSLRKRQKRRGSTSDDRLPPRADSSLAPTRRLGRSVKNGSSPLHSGGKAVATPTASHLPVQLSSISQNPKNLKLNSLGVAVVPGGKTSPLWLLRLHTINRYSSIMAFLLVVGTLGVYGLTVYSQELWSQGYQRLQKLQRDDRQITTTNATLTNKMAEEAEKPGAGLISPTPARTIFISPLPQNSTIGTPRTKLNPPVAPSNSSRLGY